jgi:hypothetical protein
MEENPVCMEKNPAKWLIVLHGYRVSSGASPTITIATEKRCSGAA